MIRLTSIQRPVDEFTVQVKDFTIVPLSKGQNYREFFNLPQNGPKVMIETIPKNVTMKNDQDH